MPLAKDEPSVQPKIHKALLTQSGDGTSTQTSGTLTIGKRYAITTYVAGDDFSNVANVVSGTINTTGCEFIATGTTPTTYSNGSTLTDTSAPVATVLVNTLSGTPVWSRDSTGVYRLTLSSEFVLNNTIYYITPSDNSSNTDIRLSLFNGAPNYLSIETRFSGTLTDELLYYTPITIEVYP